MLDSDFFEEVSQAYFHHLKAHIHLFGMTAEMQAKEVNKFSTAFQSYIGELTDRVRAWCDKRVAEVQKSPATFPPASVDIISTIPDRLDWVVSRGLFNSYVYGLKLPTPSPLMCRAFLTYMGSNAQTYSPWIMQVFSWMEPLLYSTFMENKKDHGGFKDLSHMLEAWMEKQGIKDGVNPTLILNKVCQFTSSQSAT